MSSLPSVKVSGPIEGIKVVQTPTMVVDAPGRLENEQDTTAELENQKNAFAQAAETLEHIATKLHTVYEKAIVEYRQGIAKLAVEIARKILVKKVQQGDYQIETIIAEALKNTPTRQDIAVRMNPEDLERCKQIQQGEGSFAGVKFIADASIGPAQCVVDTPRGRVESLIDEQLAQVARVLNKAV
jgi:flagellar biosynthesis/type III secretory pathway protein FliH